MSALEDLLAFQIKASNLSEPVREFKFHPVRRWRADFCFMDSKIIVEVEGGTFVNGRHNRGASFDKDCEKYAEAMMLGYRVLRVTGTHIKSGQAIQWIDSLLANQ